MTPPSPSRFRHAPVLLLAAASLFLGACISGIDSRDQARAEVSGPEGVPVRLITSTEFVQGQTGGTTTPDSLAVQLFSADTTYRELPFDVTEDISATQRYLARISMTAETDSVAGSGAIDTEILLFIDGEQRTRATGDLRESSVQVIFQSISNQ